MKYYSAMTTGSNSSRHPIQKILIRDYLFGFFAFFGFLAASHALTPTLPIYLSRLGTVEGEIGVLVGTYGVASLLSRFCAGGLLRKYPERLVMLWGTVLFFAGFLALIVFHPFWPFLVVRLVQGFAFACFDTAAIAYVIRIVPEANRPRAISYLLLASPLSSAIVASLSVFIINTYSFAALLFGCAALSLCAFLLSWKLRPDKPVKPAEVLTNRSSRYFERRIVAPAIVTFLFSFAWGGLGAFFPLYAIRCGVSNPGHFFSAMALVLIVARFLGGRILETYSKASVIPTVIFVSMIALLILAFSKTLPMFLLVGMLWGVGAGFAPPVSMAYALDYSGCIDGTAVGTYQAFMDFGFGVGPVIIGLIVPVTGYPVMFLCLSLMLLVDLVYFLFYLEKKRRSRSSSNR